MTRATAIMIDENQVVLIERHRDGERYFVFPGGGIEEGENPTEAVQREAMEELGVTVEVGPLVAELTFRGRRHYYFLATITGGTFGSGSGPEMAGAYPAERGTYRAIWMPIADLQREPVRPQAIAELIQQAQAQGWPAAPQQIIDLGFMHYPATARAIDVSGLLPEAQSIAAQAAQIYLNYTAPWFVGLLAHGSAVKGGVIPNCSDIDFQLYLQPDAFAPNGELPFALGMAIQRELAAIDHAPFRYIQCYAFDTAMRHGWTGPIPGTYHLVAGEIGVPLATADQLRASAIQTLSTLQPDAMNLLTSGGGRLERQVRLLCTQIWPLLYQVVALQQGDPFSIWRLPKPAVIELLPTTSELGQTIRTYDQAVRRYYPTEASTHDGLAVLAAGTAFIEAIQRWWPTFPKE
ncbi:MAG: NUDIX domain-containing protein [Caldilineaceae bacterium]